MKGLYATSSGEAGHKRRLLGVLVILAAVFSLVILTMPASATHVNPNPVDENANCEGLSGIMELLRVEEPIVDGSANVVINGDTFTIHWGVHGDNTFDWRTTNGLLIQAVFVKGGAGGGGNLYDYRPLGGETSDEGLHALQNPSGTFAGLSHFTFCGDIENPTTTLAPTTAPETTVTTVQVLPISIVSSTTTIVSTTDPGTSHETLPFTGFENGATGLLALVLVASGALALVGTRVFREETDE